MLDKLKGMFSPDPEKGYVKHLERRTRELRMREARLREALASMEADLSATRQELVKLEDHVLPHAKNSLFSITEK